MHQEDNNYEDERRMKTKRFLFNLPLPERPRVVGRAFVCGQGDVGQLGLGDDETKYEVERPVLVWQVANVVDVVAGGMHSLVLTHDGRVFTFGCNDEGALGRNTTEKGSEFEPRPTELPGRALKISAGDSHSACLLEDGRVFAWGSFRDSHGNMGLTLEGNERLPIDVMPNVECCDIASGADHLVILSCVGKVYTLGCGEQGQLGRVSLRSASGKGRRGKTELLKPCIVSMKRAKPIEAIWATSYCTFLKESHTGVIWAFGLNNYKQLIVDRDLDSVIKPVKIQIDNIKEIAGGQHHTLVLKTDGTVYAIGRRHYGRLGLGVLNDDVPTLTPIPALKNKIVVSVSCGEATSFALTQDGQLYAWGMGSNHQLGTGTDDDVIEPTLIVCKQTDGKRIIKASSGGQHSIFLVENELQPANVQKDIVTLNNSNNGIETEMETDADKNKAEENTILKKGQKRPLKQKDNKQLNSNSNKPDNKSRNFLLDVESGATTSTPIANNHGKLAEAPQSQQNITGSSSNKGIAETLAAETGGAKEQTEEAEIQPPPAKRGRKKKV